MRNSRLPAVQLPFLTIHYLPSGHPRHSHQSYILKVFHQDIGRHSPAMCHPHFIGQHGHQAVIKHYGKSVERANIRGAGRIRAHEEIEEMMGVLFCQASFSTKTEPSKIFHAKVSGISLD